MEIGVSVPSSVGTLAPQGTVERDSEIASGDHIHISRDWI